MPSTPPPVQAGETIEWQRAQGTFHRGHVMGFAVSNRAAYLYICRWSLRPRWIGLPPADPWMLPSFIRAAKGRTRLVVNHARGRLGYTSYADTHADERVFDRELIVEFAQKLTGKGVAFHVS